MLVLKLVNYSCSKKPINDDYLDQVDKSWYLTKHQIKHHQVFLWDERCFSSEMKRSQGCLSQNKRENPHNGVVPEEKKCHCIIFYCFIWEDMAYGLVFSSVSRCLDPRDEALHLRFWHLWWITILSQKFEGVIWNSSFHFACLTTQKVSFNIMSKSHRNIDSTF